VFLFEIWTTFVFLLFASKAISTQISINLLDWSRFSYRSFAWYINMVFLRTQSVEKSLLENSRFNLSTHFGDVLKMLFGELKLSNSNRSNSHSMLYTKIFDCLVVSKCVSHLKYVLHSCSSYCFKTYHQPNFIKLLEYSRLHVGVFPDILTASYIWGHNR
jgi:hypothetical protein